MRSSHHAAAVQPVLNKTTSLALHSPGSFFKPIVAETRKYMQKILDKNPETCLYKDPFTVFFIPTLTFQKFNDCVDLKHWKLLSWSFLQHKEKKPLKILLKSWKMKLFFSSVFLQKIFVSFPFTCHKACTFAKLRLFFQLIGSQKLVPHVPSQQFLLGTKAIYLWRTEFTVICVYNFPLFLHCFQLGSFKYSSCHTHHFQFTCYAKPHIPTEQPLLHSLYRFSTLGLKSLFIYKLDVPWTVFPVA